MNARWRQPWDIEWELIGLDTRECVPDTNGFPSRFICKVLNGSGTLIGPRTVLTAAHSVEALEFQTSSNVPVIPALNEASLLPEPFGRSQIAGVQLSPGFRGPGGGSVTPEDYAVIILQDPIGNTTGWWTFQPFRSPGDSLGTRIAAGDQDLPDPNAPGEIHVAGYPGDLPSDPGDPCFQPGISGRVQYQDTDSFEGIQDGMLLYLNDTSGGMSGGPAWSENPGGRVLLAIHSGGDGRRPNSGVLIQGPVREFVRAHSFSPPGSNPPPRPTVRFKSKGITVQELQYRLNIWIVTNPASGLARLKIDGDFGPRTLTATRAFQRAMRLTPDGIVGPLTWRRLQLPF